MPRPDLRLVSDNPARFAKSGYDELGKISLDANGESLGLVHGLKAEKSERGFRCHECRQMQRVGAWLVWVPNGLRKGDPAWAFEEACIYTGQMSGSGWCLDCAPKRDDGFVAAARDAFAHRDLSGPPHHIEIAGLERPSLIDRVIDALSEDRWQFRVTMFCYAVATLAGCYFAWQLGRGAL